MFEADYFYRTSARGSPPCAPSPRLQLPVRVLLSPPAVAALQLRVVCRRTPSPMAPMPCMNDAPGEYISVPLTIVAHSDDRYSEVRRLRIARPNRNRIHPPLILPEQPSLTDLLSRRRACLMLRVVPAYQRVAFSCAFMYCAWAISASRRATSLASRAVA